MWSADFLEARRTNSPIFSGLKGLFKVAKAACSLMLLMLLLLAGVMLPEFWEEPPSAQSGSSSLIEPIYDLSISEETNRLLIRTRNGVLIRDFETGALIHELPAGSNSILQVAWVPQSGSFLVADRSGRLTEWGADDISLRNLREIRHDNIAAFAVTSDARQVATASAGRICLWDLAEDAVVAEAEMAGVRANSLAYSPDGKLLLAGCDNGSLWVFRARDLRVVGCFRQSVSTIVAARLIGGGRQIVAGHLDGTFYVLDAKTGRAIRRGDLGLGGLLAMVVSPDEELLAIADWRKKIHLYSLDTLEEIACLSGHQLPVASLQFSQTGRKLYSAGHDGTIRTWDIETFAEVGCFLGTLPVASD